MIYALIILGVLILAFFLESFREQRILKVTSYDVTTDRKNIDKCLEFISDYHEAHHLNAKIISKIKEIKPDMVLVGGDMLNGKNPKERVSNAARLLNDIVSDYPVYLALGNHERKVRDDYYETAGLWDLFYDELSSEVKILVDDKINIDDLNIYGLDIPTEYYSRIRYPELKSDLIIEKLGQPDKNKYNILLAHTPDFINGYSDWGADLILSGHFHGGMVRLPFLGGVISPRLKLFPKYDYGKYQQSDSVMLVSSGLGAHSIKIRFNNIPEIVKIHIKSSN
jgi:predicted MPP superfamily phosphohydrolase